MCKTHYARGAPCYRCVTRFVPGSTHTLLRPPPLCLTVRNSAIHRSLRHLHRPWITLRRHRPSSIPSYGCLRQPKGASDSWNLGYSDHHRSASSHLGRRCPVCPSLAWTYYLTWNHCLWTGSSYTTIYRPGSAAGGGPSRPPCCAPKRGGFYPIFGRTICAPGSLCWCRRRLHTTYDSGDISQVTGQRLCRS